MLLGEISSKMAAKEANESPPHELVALRCLANNLRSQSPQLRCPLLVLRDCRCGNRGPTLIQIRAFVFRRLFFHHRRRRRSQGRVGAVLWRSSEDVQDESQIPWPRNVVVLCCDEAGMARQDRDVDVFGIQAALELDLEPLVQEFGPAVSK